MPFRKRPKIEPTGDWPQLQLQLAWPEQVSYELIRPVVLFGCSPAERAKQTGVPERTLHAAAVAGFRVFRRWELRPVMLRFGNSSWVVDTTHACGPTIGAAEVVAQRTPALVNPCVTDQLAEIAGGPQGPRP